MKKSLVGFFVLSVLLYSNALLANNDVISAELEGVITAHVVATSKESESISDLMKTLHTNSPRVQCI